MSYFFLLKSLEVCFFKDFPCIGYNFICGIFLRFPVHLQSLPSGIQSLYYNELNIWSYSVGGSCPVGPVCLHHWCLLTTLHLQIQGNSIDLVLQQILVNEFRSSTTGPAHRDGSLLSSKVRNAASSAPGERHSAQPNQPIFPGLLVTQAIGQHHFLCREHMAWTVCQCPQKVKQWSRLVTISCQFKGLELFVSFFFSFKEKAEHGLLSPLSLITWWNSPRFYEVKAGQ